MSFTFVNNGTHPIAVIVSSRKRQPVYLCEDEVEEKQTVATPAGTIMDEKLDPVTISQITETLHRMTLNEVFQALSGQTTTPVPKQGKYFTEYHLEQNEEIETIPSPGSERVFIAGETGCGKSTVAAKYAKAWLRMNPGGKVFFFLRQEDPAFDDIPGQVMILDFDTEDEQNKEDIADLLQGNIQIKDLADSLCIFDDCDNLQDKKLSTAIHKLMNDVTTNGRKLGISTVYISHLIMNYAQTRVMLNEANKVFYFPGCGTRQIENFLKTYGGMKTKEAEELANIKARWVMLSRKRPRYVLYEKGMFIL